MAVDNENDAKDLQKPMVGLLASCAFSYRSSIRIEISRFASSC